MTTGQPNKLLNLGPAFSSQLLYFLGYSICPPGPRPLIWDDRVESSLLFLGCSFWRGKLDPLGYEIYLKLCRKWTRELHKSEEESHVIEYGLFMKPLSYQGCGKRVAESPRGSLNRSRNWQSRQW
jgi:hypothetical protein